MAASFGDELRLAREARGISLRHISDQTRISIRYLEAIESNDYKRLPGGIFNRSFIKAYAKQIGFDEKAAMEGYLRTAREQGEDEVATTPYKSHVYTDASSRSPLMTLLLTIIILAILSLGVYAVLHWYQRRDAASTVTAPQQPAATQGQNSTASSPSTVAPTPAAPAGRFRIELTARGESVWVSAQVDDNKKARGILLEPDKTEALDAAERLKIQYAPVKAKALEVTINGRKARVPADKGEMLITKEDYEQFLQ
jgi:cytoskeleton protein RodZ